MASLGFLEALRRPVPRLLGGWKGAAFSERGEKLGEKRGGILFLLTVGIEPQHSRTLLGGIRLHGQEKKIV